MTGIRTKYGYALQVGLLFAIYLLTAKAGLQFGAVSGFATLVWPPTGVAVAALLLFGSRLWPAIFLGAFLINVITGAPLVPAVGIGIGNTLEALLGVYLLKRFRFDLAFEAIKDALLFIICGALVNSLVSASVGVLSLWLGGVVTPEAVEATWIAWWIGDVLGAIIIGNFILNIPKLIIFPWKFTRFLEAAALLILLFVFNLGIFVGFFGIDTSTRENTSFIYLVFPLLIWAALRFGTAGAAVCIVIISVLSVWGTVLGRGPFMVAHLSYNLLLLQLFMGTMASTIMVLAVAVAERLKVNRQLWEQKHKDEAILNSIGDGVVALDTAGNIILMNPAAQRALQISLQEVMGLRYEDVIPMYNDKGQQLLLKERPLYTALETGRPFSDNGNYYYARKNGTKLPLAFTVAPIVLDGVAVGVIKVFRDISHEKQIDRAKSEFVSIASHQLRTPLVTVKWYLDSLLSGEANGLGPKQEDYLREVYRSNQRMIELVHSLLYASRIELGTFLVTPVLMNVPAVVQEVIQLLAPQIEHKHITIQTHYEPLFSQFSADQELMRMIIQNLLSNSVKYSPAHTTITVTGKIQDDKAVLAVVDKGYGIPPEEQRRIFTKLFRTDVAKLIDPDGTGLGLYIVKSVVQEAGGEIWFESSTTTGTVFYVAFPKTGMIARKSGQL